MFISVTSANSNRPILVSVDSIDSVYSVQPDLDGDPYYARVVFKDSSRSDLFVMEDVEFIRERLGRGELLV